MATPPTYVATRLVLPREAGGSVSAWIVPLDATHVSAFETEWMPELRAMGQHDVGWDWRGELNRSANVPEFELYSAGDVVGISGVERQYNNLLMGTNGSRQALVDSHGREVGRLGETEAIPSKPLK